MRAQSNHASGEEIRRLELEILEIEQTLSEQYREFGKMMLDLADREGRKINRLVDNLVEARVALREITGKTEDT